MSKKEYYALFCLDLARSSFVVLTFRKQGNMGRKEVFGPGALALPGEELLAVDSIPFGEESEPANRPWEWWTEKQLGNSCICTGTVLRRQGSTDST